MQVMTPERTEVSPEAPPVEVVVPETPLEAQVLELAADILETEGWARGNYAAWGHRCAVGGIGAAMRRMVFPYGQKAKARKAAEAALAELVLESVTGPQEAYLRQFAGERSKDTIVRWNDHFGTQQKVTQKMREAAARLTPLP